MKRYLLVFGMALSMLCNAQDDEIKIDSEIKAVTVFLNGAQINRTAEVSLVKGNNTVRFTGLSQYITKNSVQVAGQKGVIIVSVNQETNYMENADEPSDVKVMRMELDALESKLRIQNDEAFVLQAEKEMILSNSNIIGYEEGVDPVNLMDIADYYRQNLNSIDFALLEIERNKKELYKKINDYKAEIRSQGYRLNQPKGEIVVKISADQSGTKLIDFSYLVNHAGWAPSYDVRSKDISGPIGLTYKGNVYQNTNVDWTQVKLKLSTGNPSIGGSKPEFVTWHLSAYEKSKNKSRSGGGRGRSKGVANAYSGYAEKEEMAYESDDEGGSVADYTTVNEAGVNTEFEIALPYSVPADGKKLSVEVQTHELPVEYEYYAVPKLDPDAFLISKVSGWDDLYLLPGGTNIYYQGTFVGNSYINTNTTDDTLTLSLGRDNNIVVKRDVMKDLCSNQTIGSNKKTEKVFEISVKNTRKSPIRIKIEDQIPISTDKDISIESVDLNGGKLDEDTGIVTWLLELGPGENKSVQFKFAVKYPKDKYIPNL